ncbi:MAG: hypothetical protein C0596_16605 [Marinilabiliales bacterium]|nr:MAG: hypothetical protein C0596_16605 [Marinilabiliales bacterium]
MLDWLEQHMLPCPVKQTTEMSCPGCGMQRAIIELLRGHFAESFLAYPPLIPVALMIVFLILHLIYDFKHGAKILKIAFIINAIIISLNYIINQII